MSRRSTPAERWETRVGKTALRLHKLLSDNRAHTNAEISHKVTPNGRLLIEARRLLRDAGVSIRPDQKNGEGWWCITTDAVGTRDHNVRSSGRHYTEAARLARATAGTVTSNPHDVMLSIELAQQQSMAMQIGVRIGKTPAEIAVDLTPIALAAP